MHREKGANLISHHVKDDKDVCVPVTVTFLLFSDPDFIGNREKYYEENFNSKIHVHRYTLISMTVSECSFNISVTERTRPISQKTTFYKTY